MVKSQTLEGRIYGVVIGDIVRFYWDNQSIAGYVVYYDAGGVTISHEDPFNKPPKQPLDNIGRKEEFPGDKSYYLSSFNKYDILCNRGNSTEDKTEEISKGGNRDAIVRTILGKDLIDLAIGDVILLLSEKGNIAGYVISYDLDIIRVSHENPFGRPSGRKNIGRGDKTYYLKTFRDYKILFKRKNEQEDNKLPDEIVKI